MEAITVGVAPVKATAVGVAPVEAIAGKPAAVSRLGAGSTAQTWNRRQSSRRQRRRRRWKRHTLRSANSCHTWHGADSWYSRQSGSWTIGGRGMPTAATIDAVPRLVHIAQRPTADSPAVECRHLRLSPQCQDSVHSAKWQMNNAGAGECQHLPPLIAIIMTITTHYHHHDNHQSSAPQQLSSVPSQAPIIFKRTDTHNHHVAACECGH